MSAVGRRFEVTHETVRPDFLQTVNAHLAHGVALKYVACTPAEAALVAGVKFRTVQNWMYPARAIQGRMRFRLASAIGPYCIDMASFLAYWRTGKPQGERVGFEEAPRAARRKEIHA